MISGGMEVNQFVKINLIIEMKFEDDPSTLMSEVLLCNVFL